MASSIPSVISRKVLPAAVALVSSGIPPLPSFDGGKSALGGTTAPAPSTSCEAPPSPPGEGDGASNPFLAPRLAPRPRETVLRKKMTSVGKFSLKSETKDNRSIPAFFLALSGEKKERADSCDAPGVFPRRFSPRKTFTLSDFRDAWTRRGMPDRHPRFHSTVCPITHQHFEETHRVRSPGEGGIKAELDRHSSETMHFSVYRDDLRSRLEHMLVSPLEVSERLWEVKISSGPLGSSGAIGRAKVDAILGASRELVPDRHPTPTDGGDAGGDALRRKLTKGRLWKDAKREAERVPVESVLLFRSHHALADGASIMAALSDLCDEAEEIRENIEIELKKWKRGRRAGDVKGSALRRMLSRLAYLLKHFLWFSFGTLGAFVYQGYLQVTTRGNPFDAVKLDAEQKGLALSGRSISWVDAVPLDEVKRIAEIIAKARGVAITLNDLFVSCVTAAVTRQLIEHEEFMAPINAHKRKSAAPNINVVIPVHLRGGVILPNESLGNNIGAFVTRCPGEMKHDAAGGRYCPTERLHRVHKSLTRLKHSPAPFISHHLAKFCSDYLPEEWTKSMFQRASANACVAVSNIRGHHKKLHIDGMAVESAAGFLPLPPGIPIGVVVQSYAGTVSLSVAAEKWAVPDADKFLRWVLEEYERLGEQATRLEKEQALGNERA